MKEIVFKFVKNDIEYIVFKDNDKYIPCKNEKDNLTFDLTQEEFDLVNYVFNKIKVTDDRVELPNVEYNGKEFKHFYDKTNDFNIFFNIDGSEISKEEYKYFNTLYNYQDNIMYSSNNKVDNNFIKRFLRYSGETLVIFLSSTMLVGCASKEQVSKKVNVSSNKELVHEISTPELTYIGKGKIDVNHVPTLSVTGSAIRIEETKEAVSYQLYKIEVTDIGSGEKSFIYSEKVPSNTTTKSYKIASVYTFSSYEEMMNAKSGMFQNKEDSKERYQLYKIEVTDIKSGEKSFIYSESEKLPSNTTTKTYKMASVDTFSSYEAMNNIKNTEKMYTIISNALDENEYLNENLKEQIKSSSVKANLSRNIDYIDTNLFTERLKNLKVTIAENGQEKSGKYNPIDNEITLYGFENNILENEERIGSIGGILSHEMHHVTQQATNYAGLYESMTKYLNDECIAVDKYLSTYFNILTEIVSMDSLNKYYYNNDIEGLKKEIMDICHDEVEQYEILNDFSALYNNKYLSDYDELDVKNQELRNAKLLEGSLDKLYMGKFGESMYSNPEVIRSLENIHEIDNDILGRQCVSEVYDDTLQSNFVMIDGHKYATAQPQIITLEGVKKTVAPSGYSLRYNTNPEYISSQVREMVKTDFDNKEAELRYQRDLTTILESYQYLNINNRLEGNVKISVNRNDNNLDIDFKDVGLENSKLRLDSEYAKDISKELVNTQLKDGEERDITLALNGNYLTINDRNSNKIYNIDVKNGGQPVLVQLLNQANISSDEYSALIKKEVNDYAYNKNIESYSSNQDNNIGLTNDGRIISYNNISYIQNGKEIKEVIENVVNPKDALELLNNTRIKH